VILLYVFKPTNQLPQTSLQTIPCLQGFERDDYVLFLSPHPDDLEIAFGATAYTLAQNGIKVSQIVFTDGCDELCGTLSTEEAYITKVEQRQKATRQAAEILNITGTAFLRYPEGLLQRENSRYRAGDQMVDILKLSGFDIDDITKHKKVIIVAPAEEDDHPEHQAVAEVLEYFLEYQMDLVKSVYRYQTWPSNEQKIIPNCVLDHTVLVWEAKEEAVKAHNIVPHYKPVFKKTGDFFWEDHIPAIQNLFRDFTKENQDYKRCEFLLKEE